MLIAVTALVLASPPRLSAVATARPPVIDGRLDEGVWSSAEVSDAFTQNFPVAGAAPSEPTRVRVLYDENAVYVGIDCEQRGVPVTAILTRRDRVIETDWVSVDLDTRDDGRTAFHFRVSAAGTLVDGLRYDATQLSYDWDEIWDAAVARTEHGWSAELAIPLRVLRFDPRHGEWGFQVRRHTTARQELDEWAFVPRETAGEVAHYGRLTGLSWTTSADDPVELRPYLAATATHGDALDSTRARDTRGTGTVGVDGRWHVSQDLTLDVTVNPDFGQVEADQVVMNLSNVELFFPEKRPFFVAGLDAFHTPIRVVYTRRIGRQPDEPELRDDAYEGTVRLPEPAPIYAAAKLVGRAVGPVTVGALSAATGGADALVETADGTRVRRITDAPSFYQVLRLKTPLGDNAYVGAVGTAVLRRESPGDYPALDFAGPRAVLCAGGETVAPGSRCFHDAYVGGADFLWRSASGTYVASGQVLASRMEHGPDRELADGTWLRSGDTAPAGTLRLAKEGGDWLGNVEYYAYGRRFDPNDLGFLERANRHGVWSSLAWRDTSPGAHLLESRTQLEVFYEANLDGLPLSSGYQLNTRGTLTSFWGYFVEVHYRPSRFDDREVGDGTALERAGRWGLELEVESDARKPLTGRVEGVVQTMQDGLYAAIEGELGLRFPRLELELLPEARYTRGEPRFVDHGSADGYELFGRQQATSLGLTLRGTYTFTPRLTLQAYAQLFLAASHYSDFAQNRTPGRRIEIGDLEPAAAPDWNPDFREAALNATVVLRWEYRPGSTVFLVYTRAQEPELELEPGEIARLDGRDLGRGRAVDAVMAKLSFWWGV